jgi:hypothetical protein
MQGELREVPIEHAELEKREMESGEEKWNTTLKSSTSSVGTPQNMPSALDQLKSSKANLCRVLLHHIRFNNHPCTSSCNRHNQTDHSLDFQVRLEDPNISKSVLLVNIHNNNNNINISNNQASALTTGQLLVFLSINLLLLGLLLPPEVTIKL